MERLDEQAVDPALAVLRLSKRYSAQRVGERVLAGVAVGRLAPLRAYRADPRIGQDIAGEIPDDAGRSRRRRRG